MTALRQRGWRACLPCCFAHFSSLKQQHAVRAAAATPGRRVNWQLCAKEREEKKHSHLHGRTPRPSRIRVLGKSAETSLRSECVLLFCSPVAKKQRHVKTLFTLGSGTVPDRSKTGAKPWELPPSGTVHMTDSPTQAQPTAGKRPDDGKD